MTLRESPLSIMRERTRKLLHKIISGKIIHADETEISLLHEKGYVWVLANMEEVVYIYRPTRKADFLHSLLENFEGVLITDYYPGYDGLDCRQQKCLVHLIRDLNENFLKHPYDEELWKISSEFANLLRDVLRTIDRVAETQITCSGTRVMCRSILARTSGNGLCSNWLLPFRKGY